MEDSTRAERARRVVRNAEAAEAKTAAASSAASSAKQLPKVMANVSDPESRITPTRKGYMQGYNVQVAVTSDQLIVVTRAVQSTNDQHCFVAMMHAAQEAAARLHACTGSSEHIIGTVLADAGHNNDVTATPSTPPPPPH